jgi:methanogenic corrinoid protein MtbC1
VDQKSLQAFEAQGPYGQPLVSALTYRSQATRPLESAALRTLLHTAKARNRGAGVTGMLLYADKQFFQWLEGPPESVARVWDSIRNDPRHHHVELIDQQHPSVRLFGDWDMKFVSRERTLADVQDAPPAELLPSQLIRHVAELALKGDETSLTAGFEELLLIGQDLLAMHGALIEPAARLIGDWWLEDRIRAVEITLSLSRLQTAVRRIAAAQTVPVEAPTSAGHILIVGQPGEASGLGVALVGDVFRRAGWRVACEFPKTAEALAACVGSVRFDALSLCVNDVFDHLEQIQPLADAIRAARAASANADLIILAGGRLFQSHPDLAAFIGADGVYGGAAEALAKAASWMAKRRDGSGTGAGASPPRTH